MTGSNYYTVGHTSLLLESNSKYNVKCPNS